MGFASTPRRAAATRSDSRRDWLQPAQTRILFERFRAIATGGAEAAADGMESEMERLPMLSGLRDYPVRERCAMLGWETMLAALESRG